MLAREFTCAVLNQKWVNDIAVISTAEGWLYLAVVLDLFVRMVLGWGLVSYLDALLTPALKMALARRQLGNDWLYHSDRVNTETSSMPVAHF